MQNARAILDNIPTWSETTAAVMDSMGQRAQWHGVAELIAEKFEYVVRSVKPDLGLWEEGPVPRFVAAVIPEITHEHPAVRTVGKYVKDERGGRSYKPKSPTGDK